MRTTTVLSVLPLLALTATGCGALRQTYVRPEPGYSPRNSFRQDSYECQREASYTSVQGYRLTTGEGGISSRRAIDGDAYQQCMAVRHWQVMSRFKWVKDPWKGSEFDNGHDGATAVDFTNPCWPHRQCQTGPYRGDALSQQDLEDAQATIDRAKAETYRQLDATATPYPADPCRDAGQCGDAPKTAVDPCRWAPTWPSPACGSRP